MAKKITSEQIVLDIVVNGNKAQKEIYDLDKANRKLKEETKALKQAQVDLLSKGISKISPEYKNLSSQITANNKVLKSNQNRIKELQKDIGVTGLTLAQLKTKYRLLSAQFAHAIPGTAHRKKLEAELTQVKRRMDELRLASNSQKLSFSNAANWLNKYQTLLLSVTATITGVIFSVQKMIDYNNELADSISAVQKTTGMSKKEVEELAMSFGMLETRTSRINLLKIAEEGGRIGIVNEEMEKFVETMNKATVSLEDSFQGGVSEIAEKLGKLKGLFEETKNLKVDQAYESIGSAINDLGASGNASEQNIANFATRVGSIPEKLKPSISQALGLGAAFEESGIQAEIASRGYSIFLNRAAKEVDGFAKVMGISTQEAKNLINENPVEFFLKFSEALQKNTKDGVEMAETLDKLGLNADGVNKIVGAAGGNVERFSELLELSTISMVEATSLTKEYNTVNNNLAGIYEKLQKKIVAIFSSKIIVNFLETSVTWFAKFIGATEDADGSVTGFRERLILVVKILSVLTASLLSYKAGVQLATLWTNRHTEALKWNTLVARANALTGGALNAILLLLKASYFSLTGQTNKATAAMRLFNTTTKLNPLAALLAVVVALTAAYIAFADSTNKAINKQKLLNDVQSEANKSIIQQKQELSNLIKVARDETLSKEARINAIRRLNEISPEYLGNLTLENIKTKEAERSINSYVAALRRAARAKAIQGKIQQLEEKKLEIEGSEDEEYYSFLNKTKSFFNKDDENYQQLLKGEAESGRRRKLKPVEEQLKYYESLLNEDIKNNPQLYTSNDTVGATGANVTASSSPKSRNITTSSKNKGESLAEKRKKELEKLKEINQKYYDELKEIEVSAEEKRLELMDESNAKEIKKLQLAHDKKMNEYENQLISQEYLDQLDQSRKKAIESKDKEKANELTEIIENAKIRNEKLHGIMLQEEIVFQKKLDTIRMQFTTKEIEDDYRTYEEQKQKRQSEFEDELLQIQSFEEGKTKLTFEYSKKELKDIDNWQKLKEALQKEHNLKEIDRQVEFLEELQSKLSNAIENGEFEGIDLDAMTPQEKENLLEYLSKVQDELRKLGLLKHEVQIGNKSTEGGGNDLGLGNGNIDLLGLSPEQWQGLFENLKNGELGLQELVAGVKVLHNAFSMYYDSMEKREQASIRNFEANSERRKRELQLQLDNGYISQSTYNQKLEKLESDLDKRRSIAEYNQAKRQKKMAISNVIMNTAQAIMGLWVKPGFPAAAPMAGLVSALGLYQLGMVKSQPLPAKGYEKGLLNNEFQVEREQDGKLFNAIYGGKSKTGMVRRPTLFLAGENYKPEMIINSDAYKRLSPTITSALQREMRQVRGFEEGYAVENKEVNNSSEIPTDLLIEYLSQNVVLLRELNDKGVIAYMTDSAENGRKIKKTIDNYLDIENKSKA